MKTSTNPSALVLALCAFAAALPLSAQTTVPGSGPSGGAPNPAVNAGGNASAALNNGGNPAAAIGAANMSSRATTNTAPSITGNAGTIGVNGDTGVATAAPAANGVTTVGPGDVESIGMRRERLLNNADAAYPAAPQVYASAPNGAIALGGAPIAADIRASTLETRNELGTQLDENVAAGERAMEAARIQAKSLQGAARAQFKAAADDVRTAQRRLNQSLKKAQKASADEWDQARAALAADYEAYTHAVTQAQRIAASSLTPPDATLQTR